jgi:hypothetical protein
MHSASGAWKAWSLSASPGAPVMDAPGALRRPGEGRLARGIALDLAGDFADQPTGEGARLARIAHALLVAAAMQEPRGLAPGVARDAGAGPARRHALAARGIRWPSAGQAMALVRTVVSMVTRSIAVGFTAPPSHAMASVSASGVSSRPAPMGLRQRVMDLRSSGSSC